LVQLLLYLLVFCFGLGDSALGLNSVQYTCGITLKLEMEKENEIVLLCLKKTKLKFFVLLLALVISPQVPQDFIFS